MCMPRKIKMETPKPPELPPAMPAPAMPFQQSTKRAISSRTLKPYGVTPDIRIGSGKSSTGSRNRNKTSQGMSGSLSISGNKGLNI